MEQLDGVTSFGSLIFTEAGSVTAMQEAKFTVVHKDIDVDKLCGIFQAPDLMAHTGFGEIVVLRGRRADVPRLLHVLLPLGAGG